MNDGTIIRETNELKPQPRQNKDLLTIVEELGYFLQPLVLLLNNTRHSYQNRQAQQQRGHCFALLAFLFSPNIFRFNNRVN